MNLSNVESVEDLLKLLRAVDLYVPGRTEGRTTKHAEDRAICRLLSTLANRRRITFPMSLVHRDRPDFLVSTPLGPIGVEMTEAISQQFAAYCALAEREFPDALLEPALFRWDAPHRTTEQMRSLLLQKRLTTDGWAGDAPEREWARFIQSVVDTKLAKLCHPDFAKFEQNWLSIYDNLPLPSVDLCAALGILKPLLSEYWSREPRFSTVYVESGGKIVEITADESTCLDLHDVWID